MIQRLWWKEWRALAPIAGTVAGAALALQFFLTAYAQQEVANGLLIGLGLGWAILYALVAATASFAGERETRMLGLLDALPVDRSVLWLGKATFALGSSIVLAFALMMMGVAGSNPFAGSGVGRDVGIGPGVMYLLLFEAVAWGLLWSSLCRTAITAGVAAVVSVAVVASLLPVESPDHPMHAWAWPGRLLLIVGATAASWAVLTRETRPRRRMAMGPIVLRLPIRPGPRAGLGTVGPGRSARPRRTILPTPAFYRLAWATVREGIGTWLLTLGLGVAAVVGGLLIPRNDGTSAMVMVGLLAMALLIQGVSVFGLENATGTRSFLDHQAVPPGTAWAAKIVPWLVGLAVATAAVAVTAVLAEGWGQGRALSLWPGRQALPALLDVCGVVDAFGIGLVAGMMFRRRVTAALIGLLGLMVMAVPQVVILNAGTAPPWAALAGPVVLLGASRLWAADWLGDRGGLGRWARLAGLVAVPSLLVALAYVGGRAYGIVDIGPQETRAAYVTTAASPAAKQAQELVNQRIGLDFLDRRDQDELARRGWAGATAHVTRLWTRNAALVPEIRDMARATAPLDFGPRRPGADDLSSDEFERPGPYWTLGSLTQTLMIDAVERRSRGDFAGAWDDILAQIQLADRFAVAARSPDEYRRALLKADSALRQGVAWASDPKIPPSAIEAALTSLRDPGRAFPSGENAVRREADAIERSLDLPTSAWVDRIAPPQKDQSDGLAAIQRTYAAWVIAPWWERERTRRILRWKVARTLNDIGIMWGTRPDLPSLLEGGTSSLRTPLADRLGRSFDAVARDAELSRTVRTMLDVFLDLRVQQLARDGRAPETPTKLLGGIADGLPLDHLALSSRPLGYRLDVNAPGGPSYILYSVGPDAQDHGGSRQASTIGFEHQYGGAFEDIVFTLPPEPRASEPKEKVGRGPAPRPEPGPAPGP